MATKFAELVILECRAAAAAAVGGITDAFIVAEDRTTSHLIGALKVGQHGAQLLALRLVQRATNDAVAACVELEPKFGRGLPRQFAAQLLQ